MTGQAEDHVAGLDRLAVDDVLALDDADAEAGHVVVAGLVEVGQDGRLAADQGAVGLHAAVADALDEFARSAAGRPSAWRGSRGTSSGSPPVQRQSLTDMATRSMPTVSCLFIRPATLSLVPTPSVQVTRTGWR